MDIGVCFLAVLNFDLSGFNLFELKTKDFAVSLPFLKLDSFWGDEICQGQDESFLPNWGTFIESDKLDYCQRYRVGIWREFLGRISVDFLYIHLSCFLSSGALITKLWFEDKES